MSGASLIPVQLNGLDELPRKSRHQRLGRFVQEGHLQGKSLDEVCDWQLNVSDVAFIIRAARRLDWALQVLTDPPIQLLDRRIEQAATDVLAIFWAKPHSAHELLQALQARLDQTDSPSNSQSRHPLYLLYRTLSPEGRSDFIRRLCKSSPSFASPNQDTRLEALDAIVEALQHVPAQLLESPLRDFLKVCSLPALVNFLSTLPAADLANVRKSVWVRLASHQPQVAKEWIADKKHLSKALIDHVILPALYSNRKSGAQTAPLLTQGQQYYHDHYNSGGHQTNDLNQMVATLLSCIGTGRAIRKKTKEQRQRLRDAAMFLFKNHIASRDFKKARLSKNYHFVAQITHWLLNRRSQGDLEAAAKGARLLHTLHHDTKRFCLPQSIEAFPVPMRAFVYAHANWSFETWPGERYWEEFIAQSPNDIRIPCDVFATLQQSKSSSLLSKIGFDQVQCDHYVGSVLRRSPRPANEPFALHRQAVYMLELLKSGSFCRSQLSDADKTALTRAGKTILTTILHAKGPSEQARTVIEDFCHRRATDGQVRGHFASTAFFTALATQEAELIEKTFQRLLDQSLRDSNARAQCLTGYSSILDSHVVIDTFATLKPEAGDTCLRALADFYVQRTKEPDCTYSAGRNTEREMYESFASQVLLRRLQAFLDEAVTTDDVGAWISTPWQVWLSLTRPQHTVMQRYVSLSLPSRHTPRLSAFGKWLDEVVSVSEESSLSRFLSFVEKDSNMSPLASFAPALASRLMSSVSSRAQQGTLECLLSLCGGPREALVILCDLWKSGQANLQHLVMETLKTEMNARDWSWKGNRNTTLALDWNHAEQNFLRELFDLGPAGIGKMPRTDRVDDGYQVDSADGGVLWRRICLQRSAPATVHRHVYSHDRGNLRSDEVGDLIQWGSLDPMVLASSTSLTQHELRALVTSANPYVASDQALKLLRDGQSSSYHRVISLNPATFKKLRPAEARRWMNSALDMVVSDGSRAKVTTSKAVMEAAATCASFDLDERLKFGERVVSCIKHIDVHKCFMEMVMDYFWRRGSSDVVTKYVSRWASSEDEEVQNALVAATSSVNFDVQTKEKLEYILDDVIGPLIANAWAQKKRAGVKALTDAEVWAKDMEGHNAAAISCWAAPCGLVTRLGRDNLRALLVLASHRYSSHAKTVLDCITDGLCAQSDKKSTCLIMLLEISKKVRQQSPVLESLYNWATSTFITQVWSMSSMEKILAELDERGWDKGAVRWIQRLERVGVSHLRDQDKSVHSITRRICILCVKAVSERARCAEAARGVVDRFIREAKTGGGLEKVYALQWLAVPITCAPGGSPGALPSTGQQSKQVLKILRSLYEEMGGYIWAREFIDAKQPFELGSDQVGCTHIPEFQSSPTIGMMGEVAKQSAEACKRDDEFGYFCLVQVIEWIKRGTSTETSSELVNELMSGKLCGTKKWMRLVEIKIKYDVVEGRWVVS